MASLNQMYSWNDIEDDARLVAMRQGLTARRTDPLTQRHTYNHLPVTLFPSCVDRESFNQALDIQVPINGMMNKIGNDVAFIEDVLGDMVKVDEFTGKLLDINRVVRKEGIAAKHHLGIFRSDYIVDAINRLKQVEVNTISVGFAGLAPGVAEFHRYTLQHYMCFSKGTLDQILPKNSSLEDVSQSLVDAHSMYGKAEAAILVLIEDEVFNIMDQKMIEWKIKSKWNNAKIFRRSFRELDSCLSLGPNKELCLTLPNHLNTAENVEISVVYFRTAYAPVDFAYENSWVIRLLIERSRAIKCPAIHFQLAGVKKFQSVLCDHSILERYIEATNVDTVTKVWNTFAKFYPANEASLKLALSNPSAFVLKPNREGGGNNYFNGEIPDKLKEIVNTDQEGALTLMEYIDQPPLEGLILRADVSSSETLEEQSRMKVQIKTELGVYGIILASTEGEVLFNRNAGHLLRAKSANSNETGIMAGTGAIDSPRLAFHQQFGYRD